MDPEVSVTNKCEIQDQFVSASSKKKEENTLLQGYMRSHLFSVNYIFSMQTFLNPHMQMIVFRKTLLCKNELLYLFIYPCTIYVHLFSFVKAFVTSSSIFGSQKDIEEQADAIIMYFGLNWKKTK